MYVLLLTCLVLLAPLSASAIPLTYTVAGTFDILTGPIDGIPLAPVRHDGLPYQLTFSYETSGAADVQDGTYAFSVANHTLQTGIGAIGFNSADARHFFVTDQGQGLDLFLFAYLAQPSTLSGPLVSTVVGPAPPGFASFFSVSHSQFFPNEGDLVGRHAFVTDRLPSLAPIPEPTTLLLVGSVGLLLWLWSHRQKRNICVSAPAHV